MVRQGEVFSSRCRCRQVSRELATACLGLPLPPGGQDAQRGGSISRRLRRAHPGRARRGWRLTGGREVNGAFGALIDDERVVVSWSYRQSETVFGTKLRDGVRGGHPALRGDRNRCIRLPWIWDGGVNRHGYRLPHCESGKTAHP